MHLRRTGTLLSLALLLVVSSLGWVASAGAAPKDTAGKTFWTDLTGEAEVTAGGVPNQGDLDGTGTARVTLNLGQSTVCYHLEVAGIAPAVAAHIHVGASTTTGPVVVGLGAPTGGESSACVTASRELIRAILTNPDGYYVNVHNADYPGGALRGQLSR